jgi:RNA polymerase sigma-70 factor (family 1)
MADFEKEIADIVALRGGDVRAFSRLYQRYHKSVHANILKLVKSSEASVEILQDVFFSLWENRGKINQRKSLGGWLFVVSYHMSLNFIRKEVKESLVFVDEYPSDLCIADVENPEEETFELQMQLLDEAVSELPKRKREVFRMCRYEGKSKKDVADILGLSLRTVDNYLKDANRMIKEYVWEKHPEQVGKICVAILTSYFI